MTNWAQIFIGLLFNAYMLGYTKVSVVIFDQTCTAPLNKWLNARVWVGDVFQIQHNTSKD